MILPGGRGAERAPPVVTGSSIRHAAVRTHAGPVRGTGRGVWAGRLRPAPGITVISLFCPVSARFPNAEYLPSRYGSGAWEGPAHQPCCPDLVLCHLCVGLRCLAMGVCSSWPTRAVPKGDCLCPCQWGACLGWWLCGRRAGTRDDGRAWGRHGQGTAVPSRSQYWGESAIHGSVPNPRSPVGPWWPFPSMLRRLTGALL